MLKVYLTIVIFLVGLNSYAVEQRSISEACMRSINENSSLYSVSIISDSKSPTYTIKTKSDGSLRIVNGIHTYSIYGKGESCGVDVKGLSGTLKESKDAALDGPHATKDAGVETTAAVQQIFKDAYDKEPNLTSKSRMATGCSSIVKTDGSAAAGMGSFAK